MSAVALIQAASNDGLRLSLTPAGTIKAIGPRDALARWTLALREHKAELVEELSQGESANFVPQAPPAHNAEDVCACGQRAVLTVYEFGRSRMSRRACVGRVAMRFTSKSCERGGAGAMSDFVSTTQLRAARALLGWIADDFGRRSNIHWRTVRKSSGTWFGSLGEATVSRTTHRGAGKGRRRIPRTARREIADSAYLATENSKMEF